MLTGAPLNFPLCSVKCTVLNVQFEVYSMELVERRRVAYLTKVNLSSDTELAVVAGPGDRCRTGQVQDRGK